MHIERRWTTCEHFDEVMATVKTQFDENEMLIFVGDFGRGEIRPAHTTNPNEIRIFIYSTRAHGIHSSHRRWIESAVQASCSYVFFFIIHPAISAQGRLIPTHNWRKTAVCLIYTKPSSHFSLCCVLRVLPWWMRKEEKIFYCVVENCVRSA